MPDVKEFAQASKELTQEGNLGFVKDQVEATETAVGSHGASQRAFGQLQTTDEDDAVAARKVEPDALCNTENIKKEANAVLNGANSLKSSQESSDKSVASKKRKSKIDKKLAAASQNNIIGFLK